MQVGNVLDCGGFVTQQKFISGRSLADVERVLGFHQGRLRQGMYVACLASGQQLPCAADFELRGYSQVADHRWSGTDGFNIDILKRIAISAWKPSGPDSLVKVFPVIGHDPAMHVDLQYPPGAGVPQWKLIKRLPFQLVAFVSGYPNGRWV